MWQTRRALPSSDLSREKEMKHTIITLILALILSGQVAHSASLPNVVSLGQEFTLTPGKRVSVRGTKLKIRFVSVIEDSRCPKGVQCVWQGNAKVSFELSGINRKRSIIRLNTGIEPKERQYSGYTVRLVKLTPEPKSGEKINPREYEATLVVSRQ
jgi:hypothetical protein